MARQKKVVITKDISRNDADKHFADYSMSAAKLKQIEGEIEEEVTKIREARQEEITELATIRDDSFNMLHAFALQNEGIFEKRKSIDFSHGILGFRTGQPKVKLNSGIKWATVLEKMKSILPDYIKTKEEPDKERLIADRKEDRNTKLYDACGFSITQDETFFVQPKEEKSA